MLGRVRQVFGLVGTVAAVLAGAGTAGAATPAGGALAPDANGSGRLGWTGVATVGSSANTVDSGAACFGIYTAALISLGNRFSGAMLVAGNAAFALMWGIGGIAGPSTTGAIMTAFGAEGLPLVLGLLCLALTAAALARR